MPRALAFLGLDAAMELACALVTLLVAHRAFKAYRLSEDPFFHLLHLGFVALAASMIARPLLVAVAAAASRSAYGLALLKAGAWAQGALRVAGYALLVVAYVKRPPIEEGRGAPVLLLVAPLTDLASIVLLLYLVVHLSLAYASTRSPSLLLVVLGFTCFLVGHALFTASLLKPGLYLAGHVAQLVGSAFFLAMLARVARAG